MGRRRGSDKKMAPNGGNAVREHDEPHRRCIVSGATRPVSEMVRFVIGPERDVVPDVDGTLPGRGLWLSATRDMLNTACARKSFARAARAQVVVPDGLTDRVEHLLARRCLNIIGLARRAGTVVAGFEKVRSWLGSGNPGLMLAAADGAANGRAKLRALAPDAVLLDLFSGSELGSAVGRDRVVHMVIAPGGLANSLRREAGRLAGFRPGVFMPAPETADEAS